jgi:hypothetical protein
MADLEPSVEGLQLSAVVDGVNRRFPVFEPINVRLAAKSFVTSSGVRYSRERSCRDRNGLVTLDFIVQYPFV